MASNITTTTTTGTAVDYLVPLQNQMVIYMLSITFVLGNFSNYANIFVFLQKGLRSNACSWYFITVSIGHLIFLYFGALPRVVTTVTGFDLTRTSIVFCKIRAYFLAFGLLISRYFLCLISIDRWMVTSTHVWLRSMSSLKVAKWMTMTGIVLWMIFSICMPVWYQIEGSRGCVGASNTAFPLFYAIYNLATILGPLAIMIFFNALILFNVRQLRRGRVSIQTDSTIVVARGPQSHRRDHQLIKLSLVQGIVYVFLTSLYAYDGTYTFITQSIVKTRERVIIDRFITLVGINLMYLYMAVRKICRIFRLCFSNHFHFRLHSSFTHLYREHFEKFSSTRVNNF